MSDAAREKYLLELASLVKQVDNQKKQLQEKRRELGSLEETKRTLDKDIKELRKKVAQMEIKLTSAQTKETLRRKQQSGGWCKTIFLFLLLCLVVLFITSDF